MRKYLMIVVIFISSFIFVKNVNGEELNDYILKKYDKVPDTYIAEIGSIRKRYDYFYVIARNSDKKYLYCIEPGKSINSDILYNGSYEYNFNNLTQDELKTILRYSDDEIKILLDDQDFPKPKVGKGKLARWLAKDIENYLGLDLNSL